MFVIRMKKLSSSAVQYAPIEDQNHRWANMSEGMFFVITDQKFSGRYYKDLSLVEGR